MSLERTFSILKPDTTHRNITGEVNNRIEKEGLRIIAQKRIRMTMEQALAFYAVHKGKPFYHDLCAYMISEPVVVQVLEAENAIAKYRALMGATRPQDAANGTIRKIYAIGTRENTVHGSDSLENAAIEIALFFKPEEIVG